MKKLIATALVFAAMGSAVAGCNSGSRSGPKTVFGPGSTGNIGSGGTPGGGGGVPGTPGQFTAGAAMNNPRMLHTATTLSDGRVLVTGGADAAGNIYILGEVFDPLANAWTETDQLTGTPADGIMTNAGVDTARELHTATLIPSNGRVLIVGGLGVERLDPNQQPIVEALTTSFLFDPVANRFEQGPTLPVGRFWHGAAVLADGKILIAGGFNSTGGPETSAAVYDPQVGTSWTNVAAGGSAPHGFGVLASTHTPGNAASVTILHGGGDITSNFQLSGFPAARTQKFANGAFTAGPQSVVGNVLFQAGHGISSGRALFAGGLVEPNFDPTAKTEIFDQGSNSWSAGPDMLTARESAEMTEIGVSSDQIIVGGYDSGANALASCEIWGAFSNTMLGQVNMQDIRVDHRVVTLASGQVMVIGGQDATGTQTQPPTVYAECEVYTR